MKKYKSLLMILALSLTGSLTFASDSEWREPVGAETETYTVKIGDFHKSVVSRGDVKSAVYELDFAIDGTVDEAFCQMGDYVSKYSTLATVSQNELQAQVDAYFDEMERMENKLSYDEKIFKAETAAMIAERDKYLALIANGTAGNYEKMQAELIALKLEQRDEELESIVKTNKNVLDGMQGRFEELNVNMTKNSIVSPCDGEIIYCGIIKGSSVSAGKRVIAVMDTSENYLVSNETIENDKQAKVYDAFYAIVDGERLPLEYVSNVPSAYGNGTFFRLVDGDISSFNDAIIEYVYDSQEDVITLPKVCIYRNGDEKYVYKIVNGVREKTSVICGDENEGMVVITGGELKEGDEIYVP